jgi:hypothetical protein
VRAWRGAAIGLAVALAVTGAAVLPAGASVVERFVEPYEFTGTFECEEGTFEEHVVGEASVMVRTRGPGSLAFEMWRERSTSVVTNTTTGGWFTTSFRAVGVDNRVLGVEGDVYTVATTFTYHWWIYAADGQVAARNDGHADFVYEFDASTGEWTFLGGEPIVGRQDTLDFETEICPLYIELTTG